MGENTMNLDGQVAVVTGGAQGIGGAVCERLLRSGATPVIWDFDAELGQKTADKLGNNTAFFKVNVADPASVTEAAAKTAEKMGRIDILVNSAGIAGPTHVTWDYPVEEWRKVISVNLDGTFHCARAVVPYMREAGYGRIVFIASIAGKEGNPTASAYSASKAGVIALTKSLGKELAELDIAVNCITPATAKTRILEQVTDEFIEYMRSKIPRGRFVTVEEIAAMVAWLASPDNSFTTGAVFDLSGGRATY